MLLLIYLHLTQLVYNRSLLFSQSTVRLLMKHFFWIWYKRLEKIFLVLSILIHFQVNKDFFKEKKSSTLIKSDFSLLSSLKLHPNSHKSNFLSLSFFHFFIFSLLSLLLSTNNKQIKKYLNAFCSFSSFSSLKNFQKISLPFCVTASIEAYFILKYWSAFSNLILFISFSINYCFTFLLALKDLLWSRFGEKFTNY
jgi:hypothetical protein